MMNLFDYHYTRTILAIRVRFPAREPAESHFFGLVSYPDESLGSSALRGMDKHFLRWENQGNSMGDFVHPLDSTHLLRTFISK